MRVRQQRLIDADALRTELEALHGARRTRGYSGGWNDAISAAIDCVEDAETVSLEWVPEEEPGYEYGLEADT